MNFWIAMISLFAAYVVGEYYVGLSFLAEVAFALVAVGLIAWRGDVEAQRFSRQRQSEVADFQARWEHEQDA